jgi:hypothetical protein
MLKGARHDPEARASDSAIAAARAAKEIAPAAIDHAVQKSKPTKMLVKKPRSHLAPTMRPPDHVEG